MEDAISERDEGTNVIIILKTANASHSAPGIVLYIMPPVKNPLKPHVQK